MIAYLVGVMLGDGGVYGNTYVVFCRDRNLQFVQMVAEHVEKTFKFRPNIRRAAPNCYMASSNRKDVHDVFVRMGFPKGRKLVNTRIPEIFRKKPKENLDVVRGLFDAEGYCGIDRQKHGEQEYGYPYVGLDTISKPLIEEAESILKRLEIECNVSVKAPRGWGKNPRWSLIIKGKPRVEKFREIIGFRHPMKIEKLETIMGDPQRLYAEHSQFGE